MTPRKFHPHRLILIIPIWAAFLLSGCSLFSNGADSQPDGSLLVVTGPRAGRDTALNFIRDQYGIEFPFGTGSWVESDITPEGVNTSAAYQYMSEAWIVSVIYRILDTVDTVYRVTITNPSGFSWEGQVDAAGRVTESSVLFGQPISPSPLPESTPIGSPTPTLTPVITLKSFNDEFYRLKLQYPSSWSLKTLTAGRNVGTGFGSKTIELTNGPITLVIQYKLPWEIYVMGDNIPDGEVQIRRLVTLLGKDVPLKYVVENEMDKYLFFSSSLADLEMNIHLATTGSEIPVNVQEEAIQITSSIIRTGDPILSPTPSPTPKPTSIYDATKSGVGSGSTVSENCNMASFVSHVTVPEGTVLMPGVKFTKVWRIKNIGVCTWTTAYKLVFSTGDLMDADKSVPLPEDVSPGSTVDISVDFTTPDDEGQYQGYWILNDAQGFWFGLGDQKKGFIPIDIIVAQPNEIYAYDFGLKYCEAVWENKEMEDDEELPCPGSDSSTDGFVILIANPWLENRHENELALWVHPNEERNGWIKGTYPAFKVKNGDHFLAWVGCMAESQKCSLKFYLDYLDESDDKHNLGSWIETYDGEVSKIDLDLSSLAGQSVRFILKTEGLTKNVTEAEGFWFVPRIERP